jgi:hypothetical protein
MSLIEHLIFSFFEHLIFRSDKTRTANVLNCFKNDRSSKFIGEVNFKKIRCV